MLPGWGKELEGEYLQILQELGDAGPRDFARRLGVSECCAVYWLTELARQGRLRITGVEAVTEGPGPRATAAPRSHPRKATDSAETASPHEPWFYAV